jgi:ankyrin repeat protein
MGPEASNRGADADADANADANVSVKGGGKTSNKSRGKKGTSVVQEAFVEPPTSSEGEDYGEAAVEDPEDKFAKLMGGSEERSVAVAAAEKEGAAAAKAAQKEEKAAEKKLASASKAAEKEATAIAKEAAAAEKREKKEKRRSKLAEEAIVPERCTDCSAKIAFCMCDKKRGFQSDIKGVALDGLESLQAHEIKKGHGMDDSDDDASDDFDGDKTGYGGEDEGSSRKGSISGGLQKLKLKLSSSSKEKKEKKRSSSSGDTSVPERCADCSAKIAFCMCDKKRGFQSNIKGVSVTSSLQGLVETEQTFGEGVDSETEAAEEAAKMKVEKKKVVELKKRSKRKSKTGTSDSEADNDHNDDSDSEAEDHTAAANPSREHMDDFRQKLSADVGADEAKKFAAELGRNIVNGRCTRCHTKEAWCVCAVPSGEKPGAGKADRPSLTITGLEHTDQSSTTDPSAGAGKKVLNLANTVGESKVDEEEDDDGMDGINVSSARASAAAKAKLAAELVADTKGLGRGKDVWDQDDADEGQGGGGGEGGEEKSVVGSLTGTKAEMDAYWKANKSAEVSKTALPTQLLSRAVRRTNSGAAGSLFEKPKTKPVRKLSDDSGDDDDDDNDALARIPTLGGKGTPQTNRKLHSAGLVNVTSLHEQDKSSGRQLGRKSTLPPGVLDRTKSALSSPASRAAAARQHTVVDDDEDDDDLGMPTLAKGKTVVPIPNSGTEEDAGTLLTEDDVGKRVDVKGYGTGMLSFLGAVRFADKATGEWCGVVLDDPTKGRNDGTVQGVRYFDCKHEKGGVFVSLRANKASLLTAGTTGVKGKRSAWGGDTDIGPRESAAALKVITSKKIAVGAASSGLSATGRGGFDDRDDGGYGGSGAGGYQGGGGGGSSGIGGSLGVDPFPMSSSMPKGPDADGPTGPGMFNKTTGANAMHDAANAGNYDELKRLIKSKVHDVDKGDFEGRPPLMHAVHQHHVECVELLLKEGADINLQAKDGSTALHEAVYNSTVEMMWMLLNNGADQRTRDQDGREPIHWSTDNPSGPKCMSVLLSKYKVHVDVTDDADMTPLMWAACHNQADMVRVLLELNADVHEKDMDGKTALDWAVHTNSIDALNLLLDYEGSFFKDRKGRTAMHTAAERGAILAIEAILTVRPDSIEDTDLQGRTPVFWAAACRVRAFRQKLTPEDIIGSHACSLEANMRVTNSIPLGCQLPLTVATINCVVTRKATKRRRYESY